MYRTFQLYEGQVRLAGYEWRTEKPKAVVCVVHGIGEHAGRYDRIGENFVRNGIAMTGTDLRGHGLSSGKRGHTAPRSDILRDIDRLIEYMQKEYPGVPLVIYGHSMGGNIALDYRKRGTYRSLPAGYVITSPWLILQRKIPFYLYGFSKLMAMIKPDFSMSSKLNPEILGNPGIISKQENQHLIHSKISVKTAIEGFETAEGLLDERTADGGRAPLKPFLLMQGDEDKICDPEGSRRLARLEGALCTYIEWKGLYHEIHNGSPKSDGSEVIQTMTEWILKSTME